MIRDMTREVSVPPALLAVHSYVKRCKLFCFGSTATWKAESSCASDPPWNSCALVHCYAVSSRCSRDP